MYRIISTILTGFFIVLFSFSAILQAQNVSTQDFTDKRQGGGGMSQKKVVDATWREINKDPLFAQPYIDVDEWRDTPVKHHYVHGGFSGTDTRFSFYFPEKKDYQGHFYQYITPVPESENLSQEVAAGAENKITFSLDSGAYFVETNEGGSDSNDTTIAAYRANAAAAQYSRVVAMKMFGEKRPFGYAFGGSGGAYRTIGGIENTEGVWDGAVPYVVGSQMAIPNVFTVRMHAMRILEDKFPQIVDALEPGGSGDMYAGLNTEEKAALDEVTKMGFPPRSWYAYKTMGIHGFTAVYQGMVKADESYFTHDFWNVPGYLGADHPESFLKARIQKVSKIKRALSMDQAVKSGITEPIPENERGTADMAWKSVGGMAGNMPVAFELEDELPAVGFLGGDLRIRSGEAAGEALQLKAIAGKNVILGPGNPNVLVKIKPGDEVQVDNSNFLAAQTYHRHQVPGKEYKVWDQFRDAAGNPLYPQRSRLLGPSFTKAAAGVLPTGKFKGKMIVLASLWDREAFPWNADWYRDRVQENLGDQTNDHFRLWYTDHAEHSDLLKQEDPTHIVGYLGDLQQALRDLSGWTEHGITPPATTNYKVVDGQVIVPAAANERKGIQPVVDLKANGSKRADTSVGEAITFTAVIEVPPNSGKIVSAEWDFDGSGNFSDKVNSSAFKADHSGSVTIHASHSYTKPGTYFVTLHVASQRDGDSKTPFAKIQNLDRVRVVVK